MRDRRVGDARLEGETVVVLCSCGSRMTAEMGGRLGEPSYLWWRCVDNANHITRAIPVPEALAGRAA